MGYDLTEHCCEYAGWFIADKIMPDTGKLYLEDFVEIQQDNYKDKDFSGYNFDVNFFHQESYYENEEGTTVVFRIVNVHLNDVMYLHLFNCHNGYYSHGFKFSVDQPDEYVIREDDI